MKKHHQLMAVALLLVTGFAFGLIGGNPETTAKSTKAISPAVQAAPPNVASRSILSNGWNGGADGAVVARLDSQQMVESTVGRKDGDTTVSEVCRKVGVLNPQDIIPATDEAYQLKIEQARFYNWWRTFTGRITAASLANEVALGRITAQTASVILAGALRGTCGGGGGAASPTPTPIVSVTITSPANGATNVATNAPLTATFTIANGTYVSHALTANCNGTVATQSQQLAAGVTSGTVSATPATSWTAGQPCTFRVTVNATANVSSFTEVTASMAALSVPLTALIPVATPSATGSQPVMVIDLTTGTIASAGVNINVSTGCNAGNLTNGHLVRISCTLGASHWDYNPLTRTSTQNTSLTNIPASRWATVVSSPSGADYYGVGSPGTGQVLVRNGNAFVGSGIDISTKSTP